MRVIHRLYFQVNTHLKIGEDVTEKPYIYLKSFSNKNGYGAISTNHPSTRWFHQLLEDNYEDHQLLET